MKRRHVVLVGLPGCGKSTVGLAAARLLGAPFTDVDAEIERETGAPVSDIFALRGEPEFRELESRAMARALDAAPHLVAPGGGWVVQPGNFELARDRALLIYLAITPDVAARRLGLDATRPMLAAGDLVARLTQLLAERESCYRRAPVEVEASGEPAVIAGAVVGAAKALAGW